MKLCGDETFGIEASRQVPPQRREEELLGTQRREEELLSTQRREEELLSTQRREEELLGTQRREEELLGTQRREEELIGTQRREEELIGTQRREEELIGTQRREEEFLGTQRREEEFLGTQRREEEFLESPDFYANSPTPSLLEFLQNLCGESDSAENTRFTQQTTPPHIDYETGVSLTDHPDVTKNGESTTPQPEFALTPIEDALHRMQNGDDLGSSTFIVGSPTPSPSELLLNRCGESDPLENTRFNEPTPSQVLSHDEGERVCAGEDEIYRATQPLEIASDQPLETEQTSTYPSSGFQEGYGLDEEAANDDEGVSPSTSPSPASTPDASAATVVPSLLNLFSGFAARRS
ncbi:hypothetical protein FQA47_007684 [Oryzias melastigma]|uniref:Uncharacterized protein n=1 Tax=Oryzias melastigma TaxID=30732 RepID=A0A834F9B5_ORYME|nr:hypothetical protein FQA47_007684 [Oryzias melastigma]